MIPRKILTGENGRPVSPAKISKEIHKFGDSYNNAVKEIISNSRVLDDDGEVFIKCASRLLSNFKMTRRGPFHVTSLDENLHRCWDEVRADLLEINKSVLKSGLSRDRYLLELNDKAREDLIAKIWIITKRLLPITMSRASYGLVGASKILFRSSLKLLYP